MLIVLPGDGDGADPMDLHRGSVSKTYCTTHELVKARQHLPTARHVIRGACVQDPHAFMIHAREHAFLIQEHRWCVLDQLTDHRAHMCHHQCPGFDVSRGVVSTLLPFFLLLGLALPCKVPILLALVASTVSPRRPHGRESDSGVVRFTAATLPGLVLTDIMATAALLIRAG